MSSEFTKKGARSGASSASSLVLVLTYQVLIHPQDAYLTFTLVLGGGEGGFRLYKDIDSRAEPSQVAGSSGHG